MSRRRRFPEAVAEAVTARAGGICEALIAGVCGSRAEHMHHRQLKSGGGKDTPANCLHICHLCHDHVHKNPAEAMENGWIVSKFVDDPASVPVSRWGHMTLLDDDGTVTLAML